MKHLPWILILDLFGCRQNESEPPPYFQTEKVAAPTPLFEDVISTVNGISFSSDGYTIYTSNNIERRFANDRQYASIFTQEYKSGNWTKPKRLDLGIDIDAYHPVLSSDNQLLFFNSRTHLDSGNRSIKHNVWVASWEDGGWKNPRMVAGVNSTFYDSYPSIATNKNLYFNSDRPGGKGGMDIYVARYVEGVYRTPQPIEILNSSDEENDLVVDPDERFIIFNRYFHSNRELDFYISFNVEDEWTVPRLLDNINTSEGWELTPSLTPDGNYFLYELNGTIMQVDLGSLIYPEEIEDYGMRERLVD